MSGIRNEYDFENAPCGFLSFYPDGKIAHANQTLLTWIRYTAEEVVLKKRLRDIVSFGGYLYYQMYVLPLLNMQGYVNEISLDLVSPDRSVTSCLFNASVQRNDDNSVRIINAILFSIADRKKYEVEILKAKTQAENEKRRFEFLANTLPNILWTTLPSGKINFTNDRYREYFAPFAGEGGPFFIRHILYPEDTPVAMEAWKTAMKKLHEVQLELRLKNAAGSYRWFFIRIIPCLDREGNLSQWLGSCTDIHIQKENQLKILNNLSLELSEASSNIEQKARTLKELAFAQSHLVRSPLSKILGLISLLQNCEVDEEARFILLLLSQSSAELDTIITGIVSKSHGPAIMPGAV